MKSIRFYLIVALLSTVTLGNFVAAVNGYRASMSEVQNLLDMQLADTASLLLTMRAPDEELSRLASNRLAYQMWTESGALIVRSENSSEQPMAAFSNGYTDANFRGNRWRVLSRLDEQSRRWVMVAERIDIRIKLADQIILKSVFPIVFSLPVIGLIVWLVVGNGLSLIRRLADELRNKRADDLEPLHTTNPPVELAPVVDAINDLLQRLEGSVERERRFSADAAHELRTPLSALKVHVHNLKKELPEKTDALQTLDDDLGRLGHLIEQILLLYRTAPDHYQARMQQVDLHRLTQSVIGDLFDDIERAEQSIALAGSAQWITGDEASLTILLRNLIQNASKYSPRHASIDVAVEASGDTTLLTVSDSGPGIPDDEIARVFDRFYRVGGDRHASRVNGVGLGLSIVKHIADLHAARVSMVNKADSAGLNVTVEFPSRRRGEAAPERRSV